jgi:single-stranded DNA-specific DHH superfamily exonuclease
LYIDTKIYDDEWDYELIQGLEGLAPFGEWNKEPQLLFENVNIEKIEKVWKNGNGHMKIHWVFGDKKINFLFRWKGDMIKNINTNSKINVVWKIKKDDFNWGYYVNWLELIE